MNLKPIVAMLVIAAAPVCAQAQRTPATKADVQNVFKIISEDKAKTQIFCDIGKIGDEMEQANARRELQEGRRVVSEGGRIGQTTGSRICRIDGWDWGRGPGVRGRSGNQVNDTGTRQVVCPVEAESF